MISLPVIAAKLLQHDWDFFVNFVSSWLKYFTMKIIFMGTPDFALPGLNEIYRRGIEIAAVVTRPDQQAGRGKRITASPVKERGLELGLKVWQPASLKDTDFLDRIREVSPDLVVVSAYGKFIPDKVLSLARYRGINLHPSLLPRYRARRRSSGPD